MDILLTLPILEGMRAIDGWLDDDEADLLVAGVARALSNATSVTAVVEIGSYAGRSTTVLGSVVKTVRPDACVYAIDPHEGILTGHDGGVMRVSGTLDAFRRTIAKAGLEEVVVPIVQRSREVRWEQPIAFLFVDGMHDYSSIRDDFSYFEPWLPLGAYVAFHDYGRQLPSVKAFVDELVVSGVLVWVALAGSLALLRYARVGGAHRIVSGDSDTDGDDVERPTTLLRIAHLSALAAGGVLTACATRDIVVDTKASAADLVTDADLAAEAAIRKTIRHHRPHDAILGEEGGEERGRSSVRWIIDALDGTVNYVAGVPEWAVSVAAESRGGGGGGGGGGVIAAVVHAPALGRTYSAIRGQGAWRNGVPCPVRRVTAGSLAESIVSTGFAPDLKCRAAQLGQLARVLPRVRDVRCRGAASLELCAVASGEADAYYESDLHIWDIAAGQLIVLESGAQLVGDAAPGDVPLIAAPKGIATALLDVLSGAGGETA